VKRTFLSSVAMWTWCTDERGALSLSDWRVYSRFVLVLAGAVLMVLFNADRYEVRRQGATSSAAVVTSIHSG
jgi:hypothetical protein